jgi:hypothetical protein
MINKDNTFLEKENNGITPEAVNEALDSLPSNYETSTDCFRTKVGSSLKLTQKFISHV